MVMKAAAPSTAGTKKPLVRRWLLLTHGGMEHPFAILTTGDAGSVQSKAADLLAAPDSATTRSVVILREEVPGAFAPYLEMWRAPGGKIHHALADEEERGPGHYLGAAPAAEEE